MTHLWPYGGTPLRAKCSPLICRCALIIIVAGSVLPSSALLSPVRAQRTPGAMISVLESSPQHIVVELAVGVYEIETVEHAGEVFQRVRVQGATEFEVPGAPRVPILGAMLGVPSTSNLSVRIIDANYDTRTSSRPYPSPQFSLAGDSMNAFGDGAVQELFALDESIYARDAFYPGGAVSIGTTGLMRDQPVVQVQFFPVQFNPVAGEVRLYRRIQAEVTWEADLVAAAADRRTTSTPYENVMQSALLNYDSLPRPEKEISPSPMMAAADAHPADASDETLKLTVNEDGLYQVTSDALTVAGLNLNSVDPRNIKVHNQGRQIPILVTGESDGVFDPGDTVLFYGTAIKDVYTAANVYWLSVGETVGKRMSQRNGMPSATDGAPHRYPLNLHAEEDTADRQNMLNGENQDHWFWGKRISPNTGGMPASRSYSVTLRNIATDTLTATIKVSLKGYTSLAHRTKIHLNGTEIDDQQWEGQVIFGHEIDVDHSLLKEGENEILVETVDTGAFVDQILVDLD